MLRRSLLPVAALALAACTVNGTVDNVPHRSAVDVTGVHAAGPTASRPDCPAQSVCPSQLHIECHEDVTTGCNVCECARHH